MKKIPQALLISILIFAPIAFGTVEQWSMLTVEILISLAFLGCCIHLIQTSGNFLTVPGLLPLFLLVGWMIFQVIPLPAFVVKFLSPATFQAYQPVYDMASEGSRWMPLTVYQKATVMECLKLVSSLLLYVLTIQLLRSGERLKQTVTICSWLAVGIAIVAILQKFSSPDKIYWFRSVPANANPGGPWINRSQFCGYMEMIFPLALALSLYYRPAFSTKESLRKRIVTMFTMPGGNRYIFLGFGALIMASSIFISLSRGGMIALSLSFLFFFFVLSRKKSKYSGLFYGSSIVCLVLSVAWFGWNPILERFDQMFSATGGLSIDRFSLWSDSLRIFKDFWLMGSGFGTFANVFPGYKTIPGNFLYEHAHNDYIELLTDGGLIGFILVAWFMTAVLREGWKMLGSRRDRYSVLISIGALTGIVAMLLHSMSDFNMHNGADALYFFFLCGLFVSAGHTRLQLQTESTLLRPLLWPSKNTFLAIGCLFLCAVSILQTRSILAHRKVESVRYIYLNRQLAEKYLYEILQAIDRAASLDPLEGIYPHLLGDVERYLQHPGKALDYYIQAGRRNPLEGAFLQRIALMLPEDRMLEAEYLMKKGAERTSRKEDLMMTQAEWLLRTRQRTKAIEILRKGLRQNTALVTKVIPLLQTFNFTIEETVSVLPESVDAWLQYGGFMERMGRGEDTRFFYGQALQFLAGESSIQPFWFSHLYTYYRAQKEDEKALEVLRLGIEKNPRFAAFHVWLGDYYAKEGITYRAKEEYQQALLSEPNNEYVRNIIEKIERSEKKNGKEAGR